MVNTEAIWETQAIVKDEEEKLYPVPPSPPHTQVCAFFKHFSNAVTAKKKVDGLMKIKIQNFLQGKIKAHCSLRNEPYYYTIHCELDH